MAPKLKRYRCRAVEAPAPPPVVQNNPNRRDLSARKIVPTRYIDDVILEHLGLKERVHEMFARIGWAQFVHMRPATFAELTREFFETFTWDGRECTFSLEGQQHTLIRKTMREIFRFRPGECLPPSSWQDPEVMQGIWESFPIIPGGKTYSSSCTKDSAFYDPVWRIVHKILSSTVCARHLSPGVVNKKEFWFLHCMKEGIVVDPTDIMLERMLHSTTRSAGAIAMGGYVTQIAIYLGLFRGGFPYKSVPGSTFIDFHTLENMDVIKLWEPLNRWVIWWPPSDRDRLKAQYNSGIAKYDPMAAEQHPVLRSATDEAGPSHCRPDQGTGYGDYPPYVHDLTARLDALDSRFASLSTQVNRTLATINQSQTSFREESLARYDSMERNINARLESLEHNLARFFQHFQFPPTSPA